MKRGAIVQAITEQLKTNGMMTLADLCKALGRGKQLPIASERPLVCSLWRPWRKPNLPNAEVC